VLLRVRRAVIHSPCSIDKEHFVIKAISGLLLAAMLAPGIVAANDGPFANVNALTTYWNSAAGGNHTEIFVNGQEVLDVAGFNPAFVKQYFTCSGTGDIRVDCNDLHDGAEFLVDLVATLPASAKVWVDGVLYRNGTGSGFHVVDIETCSGDSSYYGVETFYLVTAYQDGWFPYYTNVCP
jgi:hypothetical protein